MEDYKDEFVIIAKLHDYKKHKPRIKVMVPFQPSRESSDKAIRSIVSNHLQAFRDESKFPRAFQSDFNSDCNGIIRFWDGNDYKIVEEYNHYPIETYFCADVTIYKFLSFHIYENPKTHKCRIEDWMGKIKTVTGIENAIKYLVQSTGV